MITNSCCSTSGGQYDFSRGAMYSENGQGFIVLQASTRDGSKSKIRPTLTPGSVVTTSKNTVDKIVTEFGWPRCAEKRCASAPGR